MELEFFEGQGTDLIHSCLQTSGAAMSSRAAPWEPRWKLLLGPTLG